MLATLATVGAAATLAGGYAYAAMWPTSQIFGRAIIGGPDVREFALTYDDGPNDPYTQQLLDVLAGHDIRATFFLIGRFVRQRPEIARAIRAAKQVGAGRVRVLTDGTIEIDLMCPLEKKSEKAVEPEREIVL